MSQSVDLDHPRALDFLREDAVHVNAFFRRAGVATLTTRELFDFAVDPTINPENIDGAVDALMAVAAARPAVRDAEDEVADRVGEPFSALLILNPSNDQSCVFRLQQCVAAAAGVCSVAFWLWARRP